MVTQLSLLAFPQLARVSLPPEHPVVVDLFAGGGGASEGIRQALGVHPLVAINHDPAAIEMHALNHPKTLHLCKSVYEVKPSEVVRGRAVDLLWASPDCTHFSRAKGGKPRKREIRDLAWVVVDWARQVKPRIIAVENVPEFRGWGPLLPSGRPDPARMGDTFDAWVKALQAEGYVVEWRNLVAADYGAPTTRKRLFIVARCDGRDIRWPEPTHGPDRSRPYRTAAECIDWSIPCPSIFTRKRPLAEATQRRIAEGLRRYVLEAAEPFLIGIDHRGSGDSPVWPVGEPLTTITSKARHALVSPFLIQTGYGERKGQRPRALDIRKPLGTVVAGGAKHALVSAFLTKFCGTSTGSALDQPMPTVTSGGGQGGGHLGLVAAFLLKYYGRGGQWQVLDEPLHTIVSKARFALVTVQIAGEKYVITDIGLRMLQPRELARGQGFDDDYHLTGTKAQQIGRIGNSVCPQVAAAIVRAQWEGN